MPKFRLDGKKLPFTKRETFIILISFITISAIWLISLAYVTHLFLFLLNQSQIIPPSHTNPYCYYTSILIFITLCLFSTYWLIAFKNFLVQYRIKADQKNFQNKRLKKERLKIEVREKIQKRSFVLSAAEEEIYQKLNEEVELKGKIKKRRRRGGGAKDLLDHRNDIENFAQSIDPNAILGQGTGHTNNDVNQKDKKERHKSHRHKKLKRTKEDKLEALATAEINEFLENPEIVQNLLDNQDHNGSLVDLNFEEVSKSDDDVMILHFCFGIFF